MENASKALLIAGSILIVILLIAFGVKIFNSSSESTEQVEGIVQTSEVTMFNNKFTPYIGKNKTKTDVISLVNVVISNNASSTHKVVMQINGQVSGAANYMIENVNNLSQDGIYKIEIIQFLNGYVGHIRVTTY